MPLSFLALLILLVFPHYVISQTTTRLYIPGFAPQAIIGDILGVDGEGRTTWGLHDGQSRSSGFLGTATLIAGPNYASLVYAPGGDSDVTMVKSCSLASGFAFCATSTGTESAIAVETPTFIPVRIGATVTPTSLQPLPPTQAPSATDGPSQTSENPAAQTSRSRRNIVTSYIVLPVSLVIVLVSAALW